MVKLESKVFINRSPQDVFDYINEPSNSPNYQSGTKSASWTSDGPIGVGSTWKTTANLLGREMEAEMQITDWQPPSQTTFKAISGPIPVEVTAKVEPQEGGTLLTFSGKVELGGFFKLAEGLAAKQLENQMNADNQRLKKLLESGAA
ncbi:MAG: SRPBCC family protein [Anaerolineales bacterium]|nr:MAG: SRPBCC family protein [Anaerolineales bacterium]